MPELPEVETIRKGLHRLIVGHTIERVEVRLPKLFHGDPKTLEKRRIEQVRRFGKGLVIDLDQGLSLAIHVKMTGQLVYQARDDKRQVTSNKQGIRQNFHPSLSVVGELPNKWTHVIFKLKSQNAEGKSEEATLFYNDIRQFGWIKVVPTSEVFSLPFFTSLGPEPPVVDPEQGTEKKLLTENVFADMLRQTKLPVKVALMDQSRIAGVGNIYANDALFLAGIDPRRTANSLSFEEGHRLYEAVLEVLKKGIEYGGASETNYINVEGTKGFYQEHFLVYKQAGKPCPRCGRPLRRIVLGGRGTFFCDQCQR